MEGKRACGYSDRTRHANEKLGLDRSRKIKVHVTPKDPAKSRVQSLHVAFQYFLYDKEAKNSGTHFPGNAFLTSNFTPAVVGHWEREGGPRGRRQVHLGNAFPAEPTALRPPSLKLGRLPSLVSAGPNSGPGTFHRRASR